MAAFTSSQNGNWNDGATWGNASPGVKGTDWPGTAGDTFSVGHTVTYNVSETNELGASTITNGGILSFSVSANTKLTFAHVDLTVNSGGELRMGASGAIIPAAYTAELCWNTTGDNQKGLVIDNGGKWICAGDPTYYGSDVATTLADNAENTDGDTDIVTSEDMSAKWNVGDEVVIHLAKGYATHTTAYRIDTIASIVGTAIGLTAENITCEVGVGSTWTSTIFNLTRNVKIYKVGYTHGNNQVNTNRPRIDNNEVTSATSISIVDTEFAGLHGIYGVSTALASTWTNISIHNGHYGWTTLYRATITGLCVSSISYTVCGGNYLTINDHLACGVHTRAFYICAHITGLNWNFMCSAYMSWTLSYFELTDSELHGSGNGLRGTQNCIFTNVAMYGNQQGWYTGSSGSVFVNCRFGYDNDDNSIPNVSVDIYCNIASHLMMGCKVPAAGMAASRAMAGAVIRYENYDQTVGEDRVFAEFGDIIRVDADGGGDRPSEDPEGSNGELVELSSIQSNLDDVGYPPSYATVEAFGHKETEYYRIWATKDIAVTYRFYVQTTYAGITAGNLKLTAQYLDTASSSHIAEVTHAPAISERTGDTDWTQYLEVAVTPAETGWLTFQIELMEYQANDEVWIYPIYEVQ